MRELYTYILGEIRGTWRFRWYALLIAWVVAIAGAYFVLTIPDNYRVEARVQVDTESMLESLLDGLAVQQDMGSRVEALTNTLLNRDNLERIARETDLMVNASTPVEETRVIEGLRSGINIGSGGSRGSRTQVYRISYSSGDPERSHRVVQSVLDLFQEETLGASRTDSAQATDFLERQVGEYENRLRAAEQRLAEFKRENVGLLPEQGGRDYYQRLRAMEESKDELESELRSVNNRREAVQQQIALMESGQALDDIANPEVQVMDERIAQARSRLDDLLLRYTESHPDVIAMEDRVERLVAERDRLAQEPVTLNVGDMSTNPIYQELQIRLNEQNSEAAAIETRIEDHDRRISNLRAQVDEITDVETRLADLTREYDVTRNRYQTLLQRLSTAEMSTDADSSEGQVRFRLLDPPRRPENPSGPPRKLYLAAVLPFALGVGGAFAFLLHQIRPVFHNRRLLSDLTGRPVLGSVSLVMSGKQKLAKFTAILIYGVAILALAGAVGFGVINAETGAEQLQLALRRLGL